MSRLITRTIDGPQHKCYDNYRNAMLEFERFQQYVYVLKRKIQPLVTPVSAARNTM